MQMFSLIDGLDPARFRAVVALAEDGPVATMLRARSHLVAIIPSLRPLLRGTPNRRTAISNAVILMPAVLGLRRLMIEQSIDLIHAYAEATIKHAAILRLLTRRRAVCTFLEARLPARNHLHRAGLALALRRGIDTIVSPSHSAAGGLLEAGIARDKIIVVHNAVDLARFSKTEEMRAGARRRFGVEGDEPVLAFAARFTRMKGHDVLLKALARLRDQGRRIKTILSGKPLFDGEHRWLEELRRLRSSLGLEAILTLTGWLDDVVPFYAASDVVVHPCTLADTLPLAVLEAMAASRPVIASRIGGLPELVVDNQTGLLIEPGDHVALADAIANLLEHPVKAKQFGAEARRRAETNFDQRQYAPTLMEIYDRVLQSHR
jgi:glycosyltransferase involved in cell wall biosynthesis